MRNWIKLRQRRQAKRALTVMPYAPSAFVPVIAAAPTARPLSGRGGSSDIDRGAVEGEATERCAA
ncbi:hypothetical protein N2601_08995 [Rhizobium sp. CB3060]|uniref:hypothetical protein n=1 Tax=Rhizobium sp. CB3060 TaxID=3138255 RepID=UPI0021A38397|nr:hypothetical protein [Rhizobium tropici]UWU23061.1 hypothetical protein N2601_08995 [Rhizobium tropici]